MGVRFLWCFVVPEGKASKEKGASCEANDHFVGSRAVANPGMNAPATSWEQWAALLLGKLWGLAPWGAPPLSDFAGGMTASCCGGNSATVAPFP